MKTMTAILFFITALSPAYAAKDDLREQLKAAVRVGCSIGYITALNSKGDTITQEHYDKVVVPLCEDMAEKIVQ